MVVEDQDLCALHRLGVVQKQRIDGKIRPVEVIVGRDAHREVDLAGNPHPLGDLRTLHPCGNDTLVLLIVHRDPLSSQHFSPHDPQASEKAIAGLRETSRFAFETWHARDIQASRQRTRHRKPSASSRTSPRPPRAHPRPHREQQGSDRQAPLQQRRHALRYRRSAAKPWCWASWWALRSWWEPASWWVLASW